MASKYNRFKAHKQSLLLSSPIKMYLLVPEQDNYMITCIQCGAPVGKMKTRCRDMTGVAKHQKKYMLLASCSSETDLSTEINLKASDFAKAVQAY